MDRISAIIAGGIFAIGLGAAGYYYVETRKYQSCNSGHVAGDAAIGGPFELVSHQGETVTEADVLDGPALIYFGFTYCPDVCPLDLVRNAEAIDILSANGHSVKPVFITVDPNRDTPEVVAEYVDLMHPEMIGLTGDAAAIDAAAKAYKVYYRRASDDEDYLVDHSSFSYLMDETGFRGFYRRDLTPSELADQIACVVG